MTVDTDRGELVELVEPASGERFFAPSVVTLEISADLVGVVGEPRGEVEPKSCDGGEEAAQAPKRPAHWSAAS